MTARILLAEDNESLSRVLEKFLIAQGHAVLSVAAGDEALHCLDRETVDLLILDLKLPVVSGINVLQKLRQSRPARPLPTIIISGIYKGDNNIRVAQQLGVTHYLEKPFTPQDFHRAVTSALAASPPPSHSCLRDLIVDIYERKKSGILTIGDGSPMAFLKGEPLSFLSKGKGDFAHYLLGHGKLGRDDLNTFLRNGGERLFLVQAGMLTYDELVEESRLFLANALSRALPLSTGYRFRECVPDAELPCVPIAIPRLLNEAARAGIAGFATKVFFARHHDRYPARTQFFYRHINLLALRSEEIQLLSLLDGRKTLAGLLHHPERSEAISFLNFLYALRMIDFHPAPVTEDIPDFPLKTLFNAPLLEEAEIVPDNVIDFADLASELSQNPIVIDATTPLVPDNSSQSGEAARRLADDLSALQGRNYYQLFDLTPKSFSFPALKTAYFSKTRHYAPEQFIRLPGAAQNIAAQILASYAHAYNTLANVVTKERYDELLHTDTVGIDGKQDEKLQAEIQYQAGKVFLGMNDFVSAEKALQDAVILAPNNPSYCAFLAWALYRNPAHRFSAAARERARGLLGKSLQLEKTANAYAFRGWMLLDEGKDGLAEGEFHKALRLDAREMNARRGLRTLAERQETTKKGLLRKFFG